MLSAKWYQARSSGLKSPEETGPVHVLKRWPQAHHNDSADVKLRDFLGTEDCFGAWGFVGSLEVPKLARVVSEDFLGDESKLDSGLSILSLEIGFWIELFPQSPTISLFVRFMVGVWFGVVYRNCMFNHPYSLPKWQRRLYFLKQRGGGVDFGQQSRKYTQC